MPVKNHSISKKRTRLTMEERCKIETLLQEKKSIRYIAASLDKAPSTIMREIKLHSQTKKSRRNDCIYRLDCNRHHLCGRLDCKHLCRKCNICKKYCPDYVQSYCETLQQSPYVCNGCKKHGICSYETNTYLAVTAENEYRDTLTGMRSGFDLTLQELSDINDMVSPLIQKGQSPYHIKQTLGTELSISESTLRRLIDHCELDARNIDLHSQVKRKKRQRRNTGKLSIPSVSKTGHLYKDYLEYMAENDVSPVQMDCVEGAMGDKAALLTLHFPVFHMQLAFIMDEHTSANVVNTLDKIESVLGKNLFKDTFPLIITDNGHEFTDIERMERSIFDGVRTKIFFCEPNRSDQKGACENNHKLIRYIIPKGTSLESYMQSDISLMVNHINSYARRSLFGKCPYDVARSVLPEDFFILLGLEQYPMNEVHLKPSLLKKENGFSK